MNHEDVGAAMEFPINCRLESRDRPARESLVRELRRSSVGIEELDDGYALRFPGSDEWASRLFEVVMLERECCPFVDLELVFERALGPIWLRLRGGNEAKSLFEAIHLG